MVFRRLRWISEIVIMQFASFHILSQRQLLPGRWPGLGCVAVDGYAVLLTVGPLMRDHPGSPTKRAFNLPIASSTDSA